jgi:hypothetical protein
MLWPEVSPMVVPGSSSSGRGRARSGGRRQTLAVDRRRQQGDADPRKAGAATGLCEMRPALRHRHCPDHRSPTGQPLHRVEHQPFVDDHIALLFASLLAVAVISVAVLMANTFV